MYKYIIVVCIMLLKSNAVFPQWEWQNPLPQGNRIGKVQFIDAFHGWINAGNNLLRTIDGGDNWETESIGKSPNSIYFIDALNGWGIGSGNPPFIIRTNDGGKTWEDLPLPEEYQSINHFTFYDIFFHDLLNGYFTDGRGQIFYTANGGYTWEKQIFLMPGRDIKSICFIDPLKGWAVGDIPMLKTTDGGNEWLVDSTMLGDVFGLQATKILFTDTLNGWILTKYKSYHTSNGGNDWVEYNVDPDPFGLNSRFGEYIQSDIMFLNNSEGWVSTSWGLYHTVDGGVTWEAIIDTMSFNSVYFLTNKVGFASAEGGIHYNINNEYFKTTDGGSTWEKLTTKYTDAVLYGVDFINTKTGWAVGTYGTIMKTNNGGKTWFKQTSGLETENRSDSWLRDVQFVDINNGWVVGFNGTILKTINSGESWIIQESGTEFNLEDIFFINEMESWVIGWGYLATSVYRGILLHSIDGGNNWDDETPKFVNTSINGIYFANRLRGWITVGNQIYQTTDGGINWDLIFTYSDNYNLGKISFADSLHGRISVNTTFVETADGGDTWIIKGTNTESCILSFCVSDFNNCWTIGHEGNIIHTKDGGETWTVQQSMVYGYPLYDIDFVDNENGWAVGKFGTIIHTSSGGITSVKYQVPPVTVIENSFKLYNNYPNPFNPTTTITYYIYKSGVVSLEIFNVLGEKVKTLISNQEQSSGAYSINWKAVNQSSGIYLCKLTVNEKSEVRKMLLLK